MPQQYRPIITHLILQNEVSIFFSFVIFISFVKPRIIIKRYFKEAYARLCLFVYNFFFNSKLYKSTVYDLL